MDKITRMGYLVLDRKGTEKFQTCPFSKDGDTCGDWCPLFGEPFYSGARACIVLALCGTRVWYFKVEEFVDERETVNNITNSVDGEEI